MSQHSSVWLATSEHPTFEPLTGQVTADVVVIGGGIAGLTTALLLQRDGARVALLEGLTLGSGTTGGTTGKVTSQHSLTYAELIQRHGVEKAQAYADANQQAVEVIAGLAAELAPDCRFERAPAYVYAMDDEEREKIQSELEAALRLGLPASLTTEIDLPFPVELALRFDQQAHFHSSRYTAGLTRALAAGGAQIFEHSRAMGIEESGEEVVVTTDGGEVRASHAAICTLLPFADRGGFFAKARPKREYGIAATLRGGIPDGMHINVGSPTRSTRPWHDGDRHGIILVGEGHETGHEDATPERWGELERWARQHFDVESFEHRWSAQDFTSADDLPFVGRSPRTERTFVATCFKKWGLTNGTAAAQIITDLVAGRDNPWLVAFDATRIGDATAIKDLVADNLHVGKRFVSDRLARLRSDDVSQLAPGEGGIVDIDGQTVGAYRSPAGHVEAVEITCTHMGCTVKWNSAETSWDCPCHGSRFDTEGTVLTGPAVRPLGRVEVEPG